MKTFHGFAIIVVLLTIAVPVACAPVSDGVRVGSYVELDYSLKADGSSVVPAEKPEHMKLVVGGGSYPADFEQALIGLQVGGEKVITLTPDQAYGQRRVDLVTRVPKEQVPPALLDSEPGQIVTTRGTNGQPVVMRILQVLEDSVVLDRNHPWAGRTLIYRVSVAQIN